MRPVLPQSLADVFLEQMPPSTWGAVLYELHPRDDPRFAYSYARSATREALAHTTETILAAGGSYCQLSNRILAGFADAGVHAPVDAHSRMVTLQHTRYPQIPGLGQIVPGLAPFATIAASWTATAAGPGALVAQLLSGKNVSSSIPTGPRVLPSPSDVARMLAEPIRRDEVLQPRRHTRDGIQQQRYELAQLVDDFSRERREPNDVWSPQLREEAERLDGKLGRLIAQGGPEAKRLQVMREFVEAIREVVEEPRTCVDRGRYHGYVAHTHVPGHHEKMLVQELQGGLVVVHDPRLFSDPQKLNNELMTIAYGDAGPEIQRGRSERTRER